MICPNCREQRHDYCANRWSYNKAMGVFEHRAPTTRPTWCDCQHRINWDTVKITIHDSVRIPESFFEGIREKIGNLPQRTIVLDGILEGGWKKDEHAEQRDS